MTVNILSRYKKTWPDSKFAVSYLHDSINCRHCLKSSTQHVPETKDMFKKQGYDPPQAEDSSKSLFRQKLAVIKHNSIPDNLFTPLGLQLTDSVIQKLNPNCNQVKRADKCDNEPFSDHLPELHFNSCKVKKYRKVKLKNETKQLKGEKIRKQLKNKTKQLKSEKIKKRLKSENRKAVCNELYIKYRPLLKDPVVKIYSKSKNSPPKIHYETPSSLKKYSPAKTPSSFKKSIPAFKIANTLKEPTKGTLKRRRWKLEKLQQINRNYEDDLFENQNAFDFPTTHMEDNSDSDQYDGMRTPKITLSPVKDSRNSPVCNDCYSPGELSSTRKGAEEYMHRREKRRSKKLQGESSGSENSSPEKPRTREDFTRNLLKEASEILKKVAQKAEKQVEEKASDEEEDDYFTDSSTNSN